jgi:hypothetical protein
MWDDTVPAFSVVTMAMGSNKACEGLGVPCTFIFAMLTLYCYALNSSDLVTYSEDGLKELVLCAGLAHIDSVILPVLQ